MSSIKRKFSLLRMRTHRYFLNKYWEYWVYRDFKAEWQPRSLSDRILLFLLVLCVVFMIAIVVYWIHINNEYTENMNRINRTYKKSEQPINLYKYNLHKYDEMNEIRLIRRKPD